LRSPDGNPERLIGICLDVTGRKANEEGLLRTEKLAAAGRLAATVAHEINNPLEAVMNLVFLARNTDGDNRHLLDMADRELSRVSAIAKQTLGFYRDTSSPSDVSVSEVVDTVLETYTGKLQARGITVERSVDKDAVVHVRRGDLHQAIANLISNAIDASPVRGQLEVRVHRVEPGMVTIQIADEGAGIPAELAGRIFEPFFTTKKDVGTGLGLWVSKRLIEQLGGTISFDSDTNPHSPGTCFQIQIPVAGKQTADHPAAL
jgi:signal transduction histidine kinase